ncbi:MAG: serpin family protein [Ruminococcus sp.]|nr:serpin family protein [Ruminococcus sp.]
MKRKALLSAALACTLTLTGCHAPWDNEVQTVTCLAAEETTSAWSETIDSTLEQVPAADSPDTEETPRTDTDYAEGDFESMGNFDTAFLKYAARDGESFVISPASAKFAMNMAALGAGEGSTTEKELLELFGYGSKAEMSEVSKKLIEELNREDGSLSAKNSVWISDRAGELNPGFKSGLTDIFRAESFSCDLTSYAFVDVLNGWVERNTNGLIKQMLGEPLSEDARLALVNTLYFKNKWEKPFGDRYPRGFYGASGYNENAPAMSATEYMYYSEGETFRSAVLNYTDGSSMRIFLPTDENRLVTDIIAEMSEEELSAALKPNYINEKVALTMPPFECDFKASIADMFQNLGVQSCFTEGLADFSGITSEEKLFISDVIQSAKIICDEEGTEAAAATMGIAVLTHAEPDPIVLTVDHPFLYTVESPSGETLFMGVITDVK